MPTLELLLAFIKGAWDIAGQALNTFILFLKLLIDSSPKIIKFVIFLIIGWFFLSIIHAFLLMEFTIPFLEIKKPAMLPKILMPLECTSSSNPNFIENETSCTQLTDCVYAISDHSCAPECCAVGFPYEIFGIRVGCSPYWWSAPKTSFSTDNLHPNCEYQLTDINISYKTYCQYMATNTTIPSSSYLAELSERCKDKGLDVSDPNLLIGLAIMIEISTFALNYYNATGILKWR